MAKEMTADEISVLELKERMDRGDAPTIVDVREPHEVQICRIPGAVSIPMRELQARVHELDPAAERRPAMPLRRPQCECHVVAALGGIHARPQSHRRDSRVDRES
jgi:rhodanese-related sulfurtransferase